MYVLYKPIFMLLMAQSFSYKRRDMNDQTPKHAEACPRNDPFLCIVSLANEPDNLWESAQRFYKKTAPLTNNVYPLTSLEKHRQAIPVNVIPEEWRPFF